MKKVNNYLQNVMKSVAYSAVDISKEIAPETIEMLDGSKIFFATGYSLAKNPLKTIREINKSIKKTKIYEAVDYGTKNLFQDLRTGNFYNKEREARDEAKLMGFSTDDWDDLSEFGIEGDWKDAMRKADESRLSSGDKAVVKSIEDTAAASTNATVGAIIKSTDIINKTSRANMNLMYMQNEKLFNSVNNNMSILNNTMTSIFNMQKSSLENLDKNTSSFFTQSLKLDTERNAILKEMLEMQRNMYKSAAQREKEEQDKLKSRRPSFKWNDISSGGLMPDIDKYFGSIKKNIDKELGMFKLPGMGDDSNILSVMMVSPLKYVTNYVVRGLIPATVKEATKELNDTISGIFGTAIGKLSSARKRGDDSLLGFLGRIFGIDTDAKRSIDTSKYEKGTVPFDGLTRKAIIDVIPSHLRKIEAVLSGTSERMFDYKAGKWVTAQNVKKAYTDIRKSAVRSGTASIRGEMSKHITNISSDSDFDMVNINKAFDEFMEYLYDNNGIFNPKLSAKQNHIEQSKYPNLTNDKIYKIIARIYDNIGVVNLANGKQVTRYSKRMRLADQVMNAKSSEESRYRAIETEVGNPILAYFNEAGIGFDKHGKWNKTETKFTSDNPYDKFKDKFGNSIFNYLQNINKELTWQRLNAGFGSVRNAGGIRRGGGYSGNNFSDYDIGDIYSNPNNAVSFGSIDLTNSSYRKIIEEDPNLKKYSRYIEQARKKIQNGRAINLDDFTNDEKLALERLAGMVQNNSTSSYNSRVRSYIDETGIGRFIDKHFTHNNTTSLDEYLNNKRRDINDNKKSDADKIEEELDKDDTKEQKKFTSKLKELFSKYGSFAGAIGGGAADAIRNVLYAANKSVYEMFYRSEIKTEKEI